MKQVNYTINHEKNKHLNKTDYDIIISRITNFNSKLKTKGNNGKTKFIKTLAIEFNTTVSNIYNIINKAKITVLNYDLSKKMELSSTAAYSQRNKRTLSNNSKLEKAKKFISIVIDEVKSNKLSSIDETINYLKIHNKQAIEGLDTICTKTMYNYVKSGKITLKPIDLPRMVRRKTKNYKTYIPKRQRGTSIEERPFQPEDRSEFGHWEGDLVVGPRDGQSGALLTLLERKTRNFFTIPLLSKSSKRVYMAINKLEKIYGEKFSDVFKSITFDNGAEFARFKDIEKRPKCKIQRTKVYFARPYKSSDRGSNENCNQLIRYFVKKGTDFNTLSKQYLLEINTKINNKKRKINGYLPSISLFKNELSLLNINNNINLYSFFS